MDFLGKTVKQMGQGTWKMGEEYAYRENEIKALRRGIELGLTVIDTAEMYGEGISEQLVGDAIQPFKREELTIVTKVYPWNADSKKMVISCEESLRRLKTDYIDLYLLHWPGSVELEETLENFYKLKKQGKIMNYGVSNFDIDILKRIYSLDIQKNIATNQVLYNITSRGVEYNLLPWMENNNIPMMAYCPIAQAGKLASNILKDTLLSEIAKEYAVTPAVIMLAWILRKDNIIPIPKMGKIEHVEENYKALEINLTPENLKLLDEKFLPPTSKVVLDME